MKIYVNGDWTDAVEAAVPATDRGVALGDGLFETVAVRTGALRRVNAHLARLRSSAADLGLELPGDDFDALFREAVRLNAIDNGMVRLTLTRGAAQAGLAAADSGPPTVIISSVRRDPPEGLVRAIICETTRRNEHSPTSRLKTTNYMDNILAAREAARLGADEALLLNTKGRLAEATIANVFLVTDGQIVTPPVSEGALPGIMRAAVMAVEDVDERPLELKELDRASEALLTNSGGIRALVSVDGKPVGDGQAGPVYHRLQDIV